MTALKLLSRFSASATCAGSAAVPLRELQQLDVDAVGAAEVSAKRSPKFADGDAERAAGRERVDHGAFECAVSVRTSFLVSKSDLNLVVMRPDEVLANCGPRWLMHLPGHRLEDVLWAGGRPRDTEINGHGALLTGRGPKRAVRRNQAVSKSGGGPSTPWAPETFEPEASRGSGRGTGGSEPIVLSSHGPPMVRALEGQSRFRRKYERDE